MFRYWEFFDDSDWDLIILVCKTHNISSIEIDEDGIMIRIDWTGPKSRAIYQRCELC